MVGSKGSGGGGGLTVLQAGQLTQIETNTAALLVRLGLPVGASISADIAAIFARQGAPAGASMSADIASILAEVETTSLFTTTGSLANFSRTGEVIRAIGTNNQPNSNNATIANLNVNTEQTLRTFGSAATSGREIKGITLNYTRWLADVNIAASGATLTIRKYKIDAYNAGVYEEIVNERQIITEGVSLDGMISLSEFVVSGFNYRIRVQSSVAPAGGAASNLVSISYTEFMRGY